MTARARRAILWGVTLSVPILLLVLAELAFRAGGVFAPEPLYITVPAGGGDVVGFNPAAARRYFDESRTALPLLTPELFPRQKSATTFRILCLGESTTAGFPFDCQVPFPVQLRELLSRAYPERRVEVLNAGIAAISSAVLLDMLPDLLEGTHPDCVIIYLGHNEFYGVFGSASMLTPAPGPAFTRSVLWVRGLHLAEMMRRVIAAVTRADSPARDGRTLMEQVAGRQQIPLFSPLYHRTAEAFRGNLGLILDRCRAAHVPAIVGTLVSNERDLPPFQGGGVVPGGTVPPELAEGEKLLVDRNGPGATRKFRDAIAADSSCADAWYGAGRALLMEEDSAGAAPFFRRARDLDAIRFRATGEFNDIIRTVAQAHGSGLADVDDAFRRSSPGGIIGSELICDHLHPNPRGYYLMAESFYRTLLGEHLLPPARDAFAPPPGPYGVTDLDWDIGLLKIFDMVHRWPYRAAPADRASYRPHGDSAAARVAAEYLFVNNIWSRAHDAMAREYLRRGDPASARREYEAVAVFSPDDPWPHEAMARTYELEKDWQHAAAALRETLRRSSGKGLIAYRLALIEWRQRRLGEAIRSMEIAAQSPELTRSERQNALFYLAGFFADGGRPDRSRMLLEDILAEDPSYAPARTFLERLSRNRP